MRRLIIAGAIIVALASSGDTMSAQTSRDTTESQNRAMIERSFNAWQNGTGSPFDLLAANATWTIVGRSVAAKTYDSREAFMREVIRPFNARMAVGLKPDIKGIYADGDTVVVLFDARATARDGKPYKNTYAWFLTFTDGQLVKAFAFFDSLEFNEFWKRVTPVAP